MSMVMMVLYNLVVPVEVSVVRRLLLCMRATIISVRRVLSPIEIEKYGRPKLMAAGFQLLLPGWETW